MDDLKQELRDWLRARNTSEDSILVILKYLDMAHLRGKMDYLTEKADESERQRILAEQREVFSKPQYPVTENPPLM